MKLVAMNFTPIFGGESTETIEDLWAKGENFPWEKLFASEYKHDLQAASSRPELKPYQVVQPEGPSFQVDGQKVTWQNWDFRIGFNVSCADLHAARAYQALVQRGCDSARCEIPRSGHVSQVIHFGYVSLSPGR